MTNIKDTGHKAAPAAKKTAPVDPDLYIFKHEFKVDGEVVAEVKPRRLTGRDMLDIEDEVRAVSPDKDFSRIGQAERTLRQIGKSCGWIYEDVLEMDAADVNHLADRVNGFLF
jgi:hypothetical protein